jgi:exonuclease VII small subunit
MGRVLVPVVALAIALAGCGSDDEPNRFQEGYDAAVRRLSEIQAEISDGEDQSNREIAADFRRTAEVWERTRTDLARLDPPEDARAELRELLDALEAGVADLRAAARAARSNDPEAFEEARDALEESSEAISDADRALKDAIQQG